MNPQTRVVVTGMGIVAPNGIGLDAYWDSLIHCRSGVGPITLFDTTGFAIKIAGEVKGFNLHDFFGRECKPQRIARQTQLGMVACKMALENAGISKSILAAAPAPLQLIMGICSGAADIIEAATGLILKHGPSRVRPYMVGSSQPHAISAALMPILGVQTTVTTISAACPSGLDAVIAGARLIRDGKTDIAVVGAADSPLNATGIAGFCAAGIPSLANDLPPESVSCPFDAKRTGVVLSEGAGFLVLERMDSALARGGQPLIEILGGASVTDSPVTDGMGGLFHAMDMAIQNSGIHYDQLDYICANACSDPNGDRIEVEKIKSLMGAYAKTIPVSSIRGVTGHPLAAAGLFQVIATVLMMRNHTICPTANLHTPDPLCDLDHVPLTPRLARIRTSMANGHGMGGENTSLIMQSLQ